MAELGTKTTCLQLLPAFEPQGFFLCLGVQTEAARGHIFNSNWCSRISPGAKPWPLVAHPPWPICKSGPRSFARLSLPAPRGRRRVIRPVRRRRWKSSGPCIFSEVLRCNAKNPRWSQCDRFILNKGRAAPLLYAVLTEAGYLLREQLPTLRELVSLLEGASQLPQAGGYGSIHRFALPRIVDPPGHRHGLHRLRYRASARIIRSALGPGGPGSLTAPSIQPATAQR